MGQRLTFGLFLALLAGLLAAGVWAGGAYNRLHGAERRAVAAEGRLAEESARLEQAYERLVEGLGGASALPPAAPPAGAAATPADLLAASLPPVLSALAADPRLFASPELRSRASSVGAARERFTQARRAAVEAEGGYDALRRSFPSAIVASIAGFKARPPLAGARDGSRKPPL